ncbi:gas vesicle protein GvpG [Calothrix sp. NIES-2098]|uniref:gas vesicle protein GvpG n=1 Tax=Calothrix sp. NIES-2098 TaxID=1954171 RepID=UPI0030D92B7E
MFNISVISMITVLRDSFNKSTQVKINMVLRFLLLPITGPLMGVTWLGEKILEQASTEIDDKENLSKQLLALQLAFDMGEIAEEEFEIQEEALLLAILEAEKQGKENRE